MADEMKRFTETEKWRDPWFADLSPHHKLFWLWLCDRCDNAGIIDIHLRSASFEIGHEVTEADMKVFVGKVEKLANGKWWISGFINFQQKQLSEHKPAHKQILSLCEANGIPMASISHTDAIPMASGNSKGKGKGKGNSQEKGDGRGKVKMTDADFLEHLCKTYTWLSVDAELAKMDAWLLINPRRQKTRRFVLNWLNRIEKPMAKTQLADKPF